MHPTNYMPEYMNTEHEPEPEPAAYLLSCEIPYYQSTGDQVDESATMTLAMAENMIRERCVSAFCSETDALFQIFREMIDNLHHYTIPRRLSCVFGKISARQLPDCIVAKIIDAHWSLYQFTEKYMLSQNLSEEMTFADIDLFVELYTVFLCETNE